jgi:hypothetical protein
VVAASAALVLDPGLLYERADITSNTYYDWLVSEPYLIFAAQTEVAKFLGTFKEFPPAQRPASFSADQIIENMQKNLSAPSND